MITVEFRKICKITTNVRFRANGINIRNKFDCK